MNPVPVCLVEADIRPPQSIESTHSAHSSLPVSAVQGDKDWRYKKRSGSEYQDQRPQVAAKEVSVEMLVAAVESKKIRRNVSSPGYAGAILMVWNSSTAVVRTISCRVLWTY